MKTHAMLMLLIVAISSCSTKPDTTNTAKRETMKHPYQTDSIIDSPTKFWPEVVSTSINKFNTSFSPDGKTIYYTATLQKLGLTGIAYQKFENGTFQSPEFVPFAEADIPMADVQISPDGKQMLFTTFKDYEDKPEGFNFNIWTSELKGGKWQSPQPLGEPIASKGNEFYPIMTNNGTLYFNSDKDGNSDLYYSKYVDGKYQVPVKLPSNINSDQREADAFVARDESYMIFVRVDQPDGFGNSDLYITFRKGENDWTDPVNMGENVNSSQVDGSPYVTPDGKYLIFTSGRLSKGIKTRAIDNYDELKRIANSSENGTLNFYIMTFNPDKYKNK